MNNKTKILNQRNNLLDEQILPENQEIFTNMICYLRGSKASEYEIEVVRQDLTEMVLSAQKRGEQITTLFKGDYQQFCDDVIEALPPKTWKQKLVDTLDMICWGASVLFAINLLISKDTIAVITSLVKKTAVNWNISVSVGSLVSMILILVLADVMVNQIMKGAFKKEIKHQKLWGFAGGAGFALGLIVIGWLGKSTLFTINFFVACAVSALLFTVHKFLAAYSF